MKGSRTLNPALGRTRGTAFPLRVAFRRAPLSSNVRWHAVAQGIAMNSAQRLLNEHDNQDQTVGGTQ